MRAGRLFYKYTAALAPLALRSDRVYSAPRGGADERRAARIYCTLADVKEKKVGFMHTHLHWILHCCLKRSIATPLWRVPAMRRRRWYTRTCANCVTLVLFSL
ncbi:hypothetical protein C8R45DRAFT_1033237, partial [Mycena sanguinolenta]